MSSATNAMVSMSTPVCARDPGGVGCTAGVGPAGVLVLVTFYTYWIPATPPRSPIGSGRRDWRAIFGLEALRIFSKGDFRVFLITTGCIAIPLAA